MTLDELGKIHQTDKSSLGHNYLQYYEMFFAPLKDKEISLCEIGVWEAASLNLWADYFDDATIFGLDIEDKTKFDTFRITTQIVDQSNKEALIAFGRQYDKRFNIFIDDGSHNSEDQILSFGILFQHMRPGGFYCIEDLICAYDTDRWGAKANVYDRIRQMVGEVSMNGKMSSHHICSNKRQEIHKYNTLNYFEKHIEYIFVSAGLCIIKKIE